METGSDGPKPKKRRRFQIQPLPPDGKVQVRSRDSPAGTAFCKGRTFFDGVTCLNQKFGKVHVEGEDGLAVVNHDETPFEVHLFCERDAARVRGSDFGTESR